MRARLRMIDKPCQVLRCSKVFAFQRIYNELLKELFGLSDDQVLKASKAKVA